MTLHFSAEAFDSFVALENYFFLVGYPCTVGHHHFQLLEEVSTVKKQINRLNNVLPLLCENWRIQPYVVAIDGKAAVFVTQDGGLIKSAVTFPHRRFAALMTAFERVGEKVANPKRSDGLYLAPEGDQVRLETLLAEAGTSEELIREVLPAVAMNGGEAVNILVQDYSGSVRPINLPPTEAVRKPVPPSSKAKGKRVRVIGIEPLHKYIVGENGQYIEVLGHDPDEFEIGKVYDFTDVEKPTTFSKALRHATCDMKPQGEIFEPTSETE